MSRTQLEKFVYIVPVIFLFLAIAAFLLILLHYAATLHDLKPNLPVTALGLPEGSIRAFLAIGLMALVAVFGTFIYFQIGAAEPNSAKTDIAKQLLTMITTLLTTVVGFYFGSRSADGGTPGDLERRATALQQINAAYLKNKSLAETLRTRLADLALKTGAVDPAKKADADKAVAQLEDQRDRPTGILMPRPRSRRAPTPRPTRSSPRARGRWMPRRRSLPSRPSSTTRAMTSPN